MSYFGTSTIGRGRSAHFGPDPSSKLRRCGFVERRPGAPIWPETICQPLVSKVAQLVSGRHCQLNQRWYAPAVGGAVVRCGEVLGTPTGLSPSEPRGGRREKGVVCRFVTHLLWVGGLRYNHM